MDESRKKKPVLIKRVFAEHVYTLQLMRTWGILEFR